MIRLFNKHIINPDSRRWRLHRLYQRTIHLTFTWTAQITLSEVIDYLHTLKDNYRLYGGHPTYFQNQLHYLVNIIHRVWQLHKLSSYCEAFIFCQKCDKVNAIICTCMNGLKYPYLLSVSPVCLNRYEDYSGRYQPHVIQNNISSVSYMRIWPCVLFSEMIFFFFCVVLARLSVAAHPCYYR